MCYHTQTSTHADIETHSLLSQIIHFSQTQLYSYYRDYSFSVNYYRFEWNSFFVAKILYFEHFEFLEFYFFHGTFALHFLIVLLLLNRISHTKQMRCFQPQNQRIDLFLMRLHQLSLQRSPGICAYMYVQYVTNNRIILE